MVAPIRIEELQFNGGTSVDTSRADIIVLVGPNNSGKSRTLQEVMTFASQRVDQMVPPEQLAVLNGYRARRLLDASGMAEWLTSHRLSQVEPSTQRKSVRAVGFGDFFMDELEMSWTNDMRFGALANQLFRLVGPGDGRGLVGSPGRLEPRQMPDHAVQTLMRNPATRQAFGNAFKSAFRQNLIVDAWFSATRLRLSREHVQSDFAYSSTDGLPSEELADRLAKLPLLETQSDGIRAFAGLLLTLVTVRHPVLMLDEPETFLHPPQARLLGEYLGRLRGDGQILVATHSLDVLLGLLEQSAAKVLVVRLSRQDERTTALTVEPEAVRSLWRDPLLRFSRALDGLFHEGVVICEGDTDSQFYSAVSYHIAQSESRLATGEPGDPPPEAAGNDLPDFSSNPFDVMFAYAGGKQRIQMIAKALVAVYVPVRCIVDFDALNDEATLSRLVLAVGQDYPPELERLRKLVDAGIRGREASVTIKGLRRVVAPILEGPDGGTLQAGQISLIKEALESPAGWAAAKKKGTAEVPPGDASVAVVRLLAELRTRGVFVVPSGTVETWVKTASGRSTSWVVDVIEKGLIDDATEAQAFVGDVLGSLRTASRE